METRNQKRRAKAHAVQDGNVGAGTTKRGYGDVDLWVESADGYKHHLYLTQDEAERAVDLLDTLLNAMTGGSDEIEDN